MPVTPCIGDVWENKEVGVEGIVVSLKGTRLTLVSLTGNRATINYNPETLFGAVSIWCRKEQAPLFTMPCSRLTCDNPAFIQYRRPDSTLVEVVCPSHVPKNIESFTGILPDETERNHFGGSNCWTQGCGQDTTEVIGELPSGEGSMWNCQTCGSWWIVRVLTFAEYEDRFGTRSPDRILKPKALVSDLSGYKLIEIEETTDLQRREMHYRISIQPKGSKRLNGPRPRTLYDYLKLPDDF